MALKKYRLIPIQGKLAKVDPPWFPILIKLPWRLYKHRGVAYAATIKEHGVVSMSQIVMVMPYCDWRMIWHVNGDNMDCRVCNLWTPYLKRGAIKCELNKGAQRWRGMIIIREKLYRTRWYDDPGEAQIYLEILRDKMYRKL